MEWTVTEEERPSGDRLHVARCVDPDAEHMGFHPGQTVVEADGTEFKVVALVARSVRDRSGHRLYGGEERIELSDGREVSGLDLRLPEWDETWSEYFDRKRREKC